MDDIKKFAFYFQLEDSDPSEVKRLHKLFKDDSEKAYEYIADLKQKRQSNDTHNVCHNRSTAVASLDINSFNSKQLFFMNDDGITYCLDKRDAETAIVFRENPYNKKRLSEHDINKIEKWIRGDVDLLSIEEAYRLLYSKEYTYKINDQGVITYYKGANLVRAMDVPKKVLGESMEAKNKILHI